MAAGAPVRADVGGDEAVRSDIRDELRRGPPDPALRQLQERGETDFATCCNVPCDMLRGTACCMLR